MIKIKCAICNREVVNPKIGQNTCRHKNCLTLYRLIYQRIYYNSKKWKEYNKKYSEKYNKDYYLKNKEKWKVYNGHS